jgi:hypothetical protein
MDRRDFATITFKAIAIWPIFTAVSQSLEALITWDTTFAQIQNHTQGMAPLPSSSEMLFMTIGAFASRAVVGLVLWFLSGFLARLAFPQPSTTVPIPERRILYLSAMFLAGTWVLASAIPTAVYWLFLAVRTGWHPEGPQGGAQLAELATKLLVGFTLLRGEWLLPSDLRGEDAASEDIDAGG